MTSTKHLLLAAVAAITVAPAAAAATFTFTRIELLTSGSGLDVFAGNQSALRDLTFTYVVPTAGDPAVISSSADSLSFVGDPFLLYPAFTRLTATSTAFHIEQGDQSAGFIATACYTAPGAAVLPVNSFVSDPGCSSVTYNAISHRRETRYAGRVTDVRISQFDQDTAQLGLINVAITVPEPSTWALMLAGFGVAGLQLRRRGARLLVA
ncbi:PEPxxWA-CTERM sorting domain-containing protein [Sphingomonas sp. 1P08PE]|uniref:PEPxxWA-CTERM sorting domain-containing protein n=1 Tax=Sphingomonas sp. 1P08PE TaxID=554122 RepID=UPI00399FE90E